MPMNTRKTMNIPTEVPKKLRIKFKKCLQTQFSDTPNGTSEFSAVEVPIAPSQLGDPGDALQTGAYPKVAAMLLWYDKSRVFEVWASCHLFTTDAGALEMFSYWHTSATPRHVSTNTKDALCDIPRIKFRKFPDQNFAAGVRGMRVFRKLKIRDLFPKFDVNQDTLTSAILSSPASRPFFHCGLVRVDGAVLENEIVRGNFTCGCTTILYRRDEITNPT